jgi:exodeoxyribonuclease VII large subunit
VVIVGRGGGSLEDLWTFNEEAVARAIAASPAPVVSAVGHETDFTIADFVADLRAPTPSAAAELVVPNKTDLSDQVDGLWRHLHRAVRFRLAQKRSRVDQVGVGRATAILTRRLNRAGQRVDDAEGRMRGILRSRLDEQRRRLDALEARLRRQDLRVRLIDIHRRLDAATRAAAHAITLRIAAFRHRHEPLDAVLHQLSPLRILERGYAIARTPSGEVVRSSAQVAPGDRLSIRLHEGGVEATVTGSDRNE